MSAMRLHTWAWWSWWLVTATCVLPPGRLGTAAAAVPPVQVGNILIMSNGHVRVEYDLGRGTADCFWKEAKIIAGFSSAVTLERQLSSTGYSNRTYAVESNEVVITSTGNGWPAMKQCFRLEGDNSFLVRVVMDGSGAVLRSRWMAPILVQYPGWVDIGSYQDARILYVPFDNDQYARYSTVSFSSSCQSCEVGAFYDNATRRGLVVGSVTHDTWKTGVYSTGAGNRLSYLSAYGGLAGSVTRDVMSHGEVRGLIISSPTIFVGFGEDWRTTMEEFADANAAVAPKLPWSGGVPFGWNSWGSIQNNLSYSIAIGVADAIKNHLQPNGFHNNQVVYVNLDAYWSNLSGPQLQDFVNHCHSQGQKAGIYWGPFAYWGSANNISNAFVEGSGYRYHYSDIVLRTDYGSLQTIDGAIALDPTHPGTRLLMDYYLGLFLSYGFDYLKADFLGHGALEGVHYDTNVTTGIQAYNQGMQYLTNKIGGRMFLSESIAPIFPYQYAHSRRIACDAFKFIHETEYTLNAVTYGWWISGRLYQYSDPDHMVFYGASTNENKSRLICGALAGTVFLNGDNLTSLPSLELAEMCLTNARINQIARAGRTFRPVEGNTGTAATDVFVRQDGSTWAVAVFNYTPAATNKTIDLGRAGIVGTYAAMDLWTREARVVNGTLNVSLQAREAKLFQLSPHLPRFTQPALGPDGRFSLWLAGEAGYTYGIEKTTNWTRWRRVAILTNRTGQVQWVDTNSPSDPKSFYRARLIPD